MDKEKKKEIIKALDDRGANLPCPRCENTTFTVLEGYFQPTIQPENYEGRVFGGQSVPSIAVACTRCGFLSHHALASLGLPDK